MIIGLGLGAGLGVPITYTASTVAATTWLPSALISGWSEDGTTVSFPIASLANHNLTASIADAATGDARQVALSLCGRVFEYFNELTTTPTMVSVNFRNRAVPSSGTYVGKLPQTFTFTFYTDFPENTIADEPS